ncbi:MAG: MBOAT family O-acyltransferase [Eubacteriales bacterium]
MLFNSFDFMIFFPIVVLVYFIVPKKMRYIWLLIASYYFYMSWNPQYAILIAFSTIITYSSGILLHKVNKELENGVYWCNCQAIKKLILIFAIVINITILIVFKYSDFLIMNSNKILGLLGIALIQKPFDFLLPVGISFYTFQALSYTIEIYRGTIQAEKNLFKYALFVSFFPQLVAGPIERSGKLLVQIQNVDQLNIYSFANMHKGLCLMLWGFFEKLVIADRAAILVNQVYDNYQLCGFVEITTATIFFAFQIYCDFDGYTNIARGAAKVMGFDLMKNFESPYLATSIKEFWRRWHISLTSWFTDYIYIPLGGSRKGKIRTMINISVVFAISGLWHGASWNYIFWGILHGCYQIVGMVKSLVLQKLPNSGKSVPKVISNAIKICITFVLVDFAWLFFRVGDLSNGIDMIRQAFQVYQYQSILELGVSEVELSCLLISIVILLVVDYCYHKQIYLYQILCNSPIWIRYIVYQVAVWWVILLGVYGVGYDSSQFVYFQF